MKKIAISFSALMLLNFFQLPMAYAFETFSAQDVAISADVSDDAYVLAANGSVDANVLGDLYIAGGNVLINGNISEDLVVTGGKVTVNGNVEGDVRLLGGQMAIFGNVGDDLMMLGGQLDVTKSSIINGTIFANTGALTIDGRVKEDVKGNIGLFVLNGQVDRDVKVVIGENINASKNAKIGRDLNYSALAEGVIPAGVVAGKISFNEFEENNTVKGLTYAIFVEKFINFVGALILAVLLIIFAPRFLTSSAELTKKNVFKSFVIGLFTMIAAFMGSLILMFSIVGIPIAVILLAGAVITFYIAKVFVAAWIGSYFFKYDKKMSKNGLFGVMLLMLALYFLIGMIPYVGGIIIVVLFFIGVGSFVQMKGEYWKFLRDKKML